VSIDDQKDHRPEADERSKDADRGACPSTVGESSLPATSDAGAVMHTRRSILTRGAKLLVYAAPVIQLVRPTQALAASGMSVTS